MLYRSHCAELVQAYLQMKRHHMDKIAMADVCRSILQGLQIGFELCRLATF